MDLKIACNDLTALRQRCEIVTTTQPVNDLPNYEDGAVIPFGIWRPLTASLAHGLTPDENTPDSTLVELVTLPNTPPPPTYAALADLLGDPYATYLGQAHSPPHALTTTENHVNGRRVGLHVDNWDKLSYRTKHQGRRRLCFNLGPGTRYLLLGTTDIRTICRTIHDDCTARYPHTNDLRDYIAQANPMQCLRFRLAPGEGYIAPTELFPHDGSTQHQNQPSTAAFWLGHWPRAKLTWLV